MSKPQRPKPVSPTLNLDITAEQWQKAVASNSGGCLIADAIKRQYPHLTNVEVDMATIRVSDRKKGWRWVYLTAAASQHLLLSFDQGWPNPTEHLTIRRAVQALPIVQQASRRKSSRERHAELKSKSDAGEKLTPNEQRALTQLSLSVHRERPTTTGPAELDGGVIRGGHPRVQGPAHPNLLRGRNRIFGAKLADPGKAFREALAAALADERAKTDPAP